MEKVSGELLDEIVQRLVDEFDPEQIILFGSHAWGTPTRDSDLDLMVIVAESDVSEVQRAIRAHMSLIGLSVPTDVSVKTRYEFDRYRPVRASLEARIANKGRILYDKRLEWSKLNAN